MRRIFRQGGFLLIVGAILIILGALLATVVTFLFVARSESGIEHLGGGQALFLAESGREQALRGLVTDNAYCSQVSYPNVSFGAGNFSASAAINISARVALGSAVAATDSVIPVSSTADFAAHGRIRIESEEINYTALSTSCAPFADPACFTGAWRGVAGTTSAAHAINTSVSQEQCLIASVGSVPNIGSQRTIDTARQFIPAMMVYSKDTTIPYFRLWEATGWGPERQANAVGAAIRFLRVVHARTRHEAVLVTQDINGNLRGQVWNGASWNTPLDFGVTLAAADRFMRGFDIAYETARDTAIVAYNPNAESVSYQRWTGSAWSSGSVAIPVGTGTPRWIRLAANPLPNSNDIALILLSANTDIYGLLWTAGAWSNMGDATRWDTTASTNLYEAIGVAYEHLAGRALFIWGNDVNDEQLYRVWNGTTLAATTSLTIAAMTNRAWWVKLVPDPFSDRILYAVQDNGAVDGASNLNTRLWRGSTGFDGAASHAQHDASTEITTSRNFDMVFETHPTNAGSGWLIWGDGTVVLMKSGTWNSGTSTWTWGGSSSVAGDDDTNYVRAIAHPRTGTVLAAIYEDPSAGGGGDLLWTHLAYGGSTWSNMTTQILWTGPTTSYEKVDISAGRYLPRIDWPEVFR